MKTFLALVLGGTNCRFALIDEAGAILAKASHPTPEPAEFYRLLGEFSDSLDQKPLAAGFAVAGPIDPKSGILSAPVNMKGWGIEEIGKKASELLAIPVFCGNDANLACLGEATFGAGKGVSDLLLLTLGTGIGGGAVVSGLLHQGNKGGALEVGHMKLFAGGRLCGCGQKGHLEAYVSGTALGKIATEKLGRQVMSKELFSLKDPIATEIIAEAAVNLGSALADLVHLFDPKMILFSGSLAENWDSLVVPAGLTMEEQLMVSFRGKVQLYPAKLGGDAGLFGAMAWAKVSFNPGP